MSRWSWRHLGFPLHRHVLPPASYGTLCSKSQVAVGLRQALGTVYLCTRLYFADVYGDRQSIVVVPVESAANAESDRAVCELITCDTNARIRWFWVPVPHHF